MICMSCGANIPPEWVAAIQENKCPGCAGQIMDEQSEQLLKELTEAIEKMPNDPAGLAGWLTSNYIFEKIGDGAPTTKFHRQQSAPEMSREQLKHAPNPTEEFLKRTGEYNRVQNSQTNIARLAQGTSKIAQMAKAIQAVDDPYGDATEPRRTEQDDNAEIVAEDLAAYKELTRNGGNPFVEADISALTGRTTVREPDGEMLVDPDAPPQTKEEAELMQTAKGREVLRNSRIKRIKAQESVQGMGGGVFRR